MGSSFGTCAPQCGIARSKGAVGSQLLERGILRGRGAIKGCSYNRDRFSTRFNCGRVGHRINAVCKSRHNVYSGCNKLAGQSLCADSACVGNVASADYRDAWKPQQLYASREINADVALFSIGVEERQSGLFGNGQSPRARRTTLSTIIRRAAHIGRIYARAASAEDRTLAEVMVTGSARSPAVQAYGEYRSRLFRRAWKDSWQLAVAEMDRAASDASMHCTKKTAVKLPRPILFEMLRRFLHADRGQLLGKVSIAEIAPLQARLSEGP